ncbi:MAG: T9SS type A sorting domain-containing protein [Balneolales bacterium]|nr:T9SS type A sorting domain-containing protein [Balneolales bacterium]
MKHHYFYNYLSAKRCFHYAIKGFPAITVAFTTALFLLINLQPAHAQTANDISSVPAFVSATDSTATAELLGNGQSIEDVRWQSLGQGLNSFVNVLAATENEVFAGGLFTASGNRSMERIARFSFDTQSWEPVASSLNGQVNAMKIFDGFLYVGGNFTNLNGNGVTRVARLHIATNEWEALNLDLNDSVDAFAVDSVNNTLYIGGHFSRVDGTIANRVIRYNLDNHSWTALGSGLNGSVTALLYYDGKLYAGGGFTRAGLVTARRFAIYNTANNSWSSIGSGFDNFVNTMHRIGSTIYIGGQFTEANGLATSKLVAFSTEDNTFSSIGSADSNIFSITSCGELLFVAGMLSTISSVESYNIAVYNTRTASWNALGTGTSNTIRSLAIANNHVFAGGTFGRAGGVNRSRVASWRMRSQMTDEISGPNQGWRILTSPGIGVTYGEMLSSVWTQGFEGANTTNGTSNVYWYDEKTESWLAPVSAHNLTGSSLSSTFNNSGRGFIAYIFEDDNYDGIPNGWPKVLSVSSDSPSGELAVPFSKNENAGGSNTGWNIAGNPYRFPIEWSSVVASGALNGVSPVIFVWNPNAAGGSGIYEAHYGIDMEGLYDYQNFSGTINPFQGFWLRTLDDENPLGGGASEPSILFSEEHSTESGILNGKNPTASPEFPVVALRLRNDSFSSSVLLTFDDDKGELTNQRPSPLGQLAALFGFRTEQKPNHETAFINMPLPAAGSTVEKELLFDSPFSGNFTLSLHGLETWAEKPEIWLTDHLTGEITALHLEADYSFTHESDLSGIPESNSFHAPDLPGAAVERLQDDSFMSRFSLTIVTGSPVNTGDENFKPISTKLEQNYPNPFNPTTNIRFSLQEANPVRLEVFNMAGQRVAVVADQQMAAGTHTITFDARHLSSGVYIYRLQAGSDVFSRRMTLIR